MSQTMQAMVYHGANDIRFEQRPRPQILQPTDALIRVTKSTICGTDLGIWKGKNPEIESTAIEKPASLMAVFSAMKASGLLKRSVRQSKISNRATG
ncbi:alcohol dehydrogenase catalytic domain-containing protein [Acinetobacter indicus]|uniref:Alcohol dehydrogenase catalytic domain-containing protein n=1 Tax=Acinetobacter indicus TaxID=756892 RepID=A0A6C0Y5P1_9GAMM|nr:alcohol dehydrogenase catalytic domain-containing protein [Acinetobacter indicus]QIC71571.1 hypothetical protein FSC09_14800 [Acinetobacter indicus]